MRILNTKDPQKAIDDKWQREKLDFEREVRAYFASKDRFLEIDVAAPNVPLLSKLPGINLDSSHWGHYRTNQYPRGMAESNWLVKLSNDDMRLPIMRQSSRTFRGVL